MRYLRLETRDRVALVTLDDPERRNALSLAMVEEILTTLERIEGDPGIGAVVVTGAPPAFCAGADLSELGDAVREGLRRIYEGFLGFARSPLPTVAAVNGPAVGAGVNLALACDVCLAARNARFDSRFAELGLHPGGGHTWLLERRLGPQGAAALALFSTPLDGAAAERSGLAWRTVEDEALLEEAVALAARAAALPPELARRIKASLRSAATLPTHREAVERELETQLWSLEQPFFAERLAALRRRLGSDRDSG